MAAKPLKLRLLDKVVRPISQDNCWIWKGAKDYSFGYGKLTMPSGKTERSHRASWIAFRGDIPSGMCVLHACDNPLCINPRHLWIGTKKDNADDMRAKGRRYSKLNDEDVRNIRLDNRTLSEIARDYDITFQNVHLVKSGKRWKHI